MAKTAFLNARIDPDLKNNAEEIFEAVGVSSSQAITMFYRQVVLRRGLPFDVCIPNSDTVAAIGEIESGGGEVVRGSTAELFDGLTGKDQTRRR